jgi:SAM-dependent methyltransferase
MPNPETLEQVQALGRARLYPSVTSPNWLVLRKRREIFRSWIAGMRLNNPVVLDVGGRIQPYRSLIDEGRARYTAVDLNITPLVSVAGDAQQLPFASERFDLVICTQMLEYAPEPPRVMAEIRRVLKDGGYLLMSVPSVFPRDADYDRWRFLAPGIRQLVAGFSSVEIVPEGGSVAGFFRTINSCLQIFARYDFARTVLSYSVVPVLNVMGALLESVAGSTNDQFAVNYSVLARK